MTSTLQRSTNLTNCDKEPIHIPGSIQPHGVLLVLTEPELTIVQASDNIPNIFGLPTQSLLNARLDRLFGQSQTEFLQQLLLSEELEAINPIKLHVKAKGSELLFDGVVHRIDGVLILELEQSDFKESASFIELYTRIKASFTRLQHASNLDQLCQTAAQEIRKLTGFDRIMIYQFDKQWNGVVVAEDKIAELQPFLGLHFPASDIPEPARELYLKNWLRLISDVAYQPAMIVPEHNPVTQQPIDLSFSVLRGVSHMHIEYLKNMNVSASMSISLLKENKLWGLIACHHLSLKQIQHEIRSACELIGQVFSTQLSAKQDYEEYQHGMQVKDLQTQLLSKIVKEENIIEKLVTYGEDLLRLVSAQGVAICFEDRYDIIGQAPGKADLQHLVLWLKKNIADDVFCTDSFAGIYQEGAQFKDVGSGILAISVLRLQGAYILWFRPEVIQTVNWGGNPEEGVKEGKTVTDLHPRKSFDLWKQTISLTSLPWQASEVQAALELRGAIVDKVLQDMVLKQTLDSWLKQ